MIQDPKPINVHGGIYAEKYTISIDGIVRNVQQTKYEKIKNPSGIIKTQTSSGKYAGAALTTKKGEDGKRITKIVVIATLILSAFNRIADGREFVGYKDNNPSNWELNNLYWTDISQTIKSRPRNLKDMKFLSEKDKENIKVLYKSAKMTKKQLALEYVVHYDCILKVVDGIHQDHKDEFGLSDEDYDED